MLRRWGILLGMLTLVGGMAVATGSASAATMGFRPGGPVHLVGSAEVVPNARGGIRHQAESTNCCTSPVRRPTEPPSATQAA